MCEYFSILFTIKKAKIGKEKKCFFWNTLESLIREHPHSPSSSCFLGALGDFLDNYFFYIPILGPKTCTYMYSMFLLNILWLFCNYPFLSYIAVSNLTAIYILLLHLGSIRQHLQVHSLWGLKCLTSFFPWRFSILCLEMRTTLVIFLLSFRSALLCSVYVCWFFSPRGPAGLLLF